MNRGQLVMKAVSATGFILSALACVYAYRNGLFTSEDALKSFVDRCGVLGALAFTVLQMIQVVVPIIPGGISCLAGVMLFGAYKGFMYNYIGICLGSVVAFLVAKYYGKALLNTIFSEKLIKKYEEWTTEKNRFTKMFATAIFLPVAPDDFLCYLAGTTEMSLGTFSTIIFLGKPFAIALYSMGLYAVFTQLPFLK